jgi:hypothetical protein
MGVWKQVGARGVRLHHMGWLFAADGSPAGSFTIDETDTLAENGMSVHRHIHPPHLRRELEFHRYRGERGDRRYPDRSELIARAMSFRVRDTVAVNERVAYPIFIVEL